MLSTATAILAAAVAVVVVACSTTPSAELPPAPSERSDSLTGKLLVARASIREQPLAGTVILIAKHDENGALGVVVNRAVSTRPVAEILRALGTVAGGASEIRLHYGGPVQPHMGFVVHSPPHGAGGELVVNGSIAVSVDAAVLSQIAEGRGPQRYFIAFGRVGWGPGQLEGEIASGGWFVAPLDENTVFDDDMESKWRRARMASGQ